VSQISWSDITFPPINLWSMPMYSKSAEVVIVRTNHTITLRGGMRASSLRADLNLVPADATLIEVLDPSETIENEGHIKFMREEIRSS